MFTKETDAEIDLLKGRTKTVKDLTQIINEKFRTEFDVEQVRYKVQKLMKTNFGIPSEDAMDFAKPAEEKIKTNGGSYIVEKTQLNNASTSIKLREDNSNSHQGYCAVMVNLEDTLTKVIYVSKMMSIYSQKFLDTVVVNSRYGNVDLSCLISQL